jgi:hypothetical protein
MTQRIRVLFETHVYPNFAEYQHGLRRKFNGAYESDTLEDHWQTFQEGFEIAVKQTIEEFLQQLWNHNIDHSNHPAFYKAIEKTEEELGVTYVK